MPASDQFRQQIERMIEDHRLNKNNIQAEDDWHRMSDAEKLSWTYELDIDDQTVLAKAKMANEYAEGMLTKAQEN